MAHSDPSTLIRCMPVGDYAANAAVPEMSEEEHRFVYRAMLRIRLLDEKMLLMQRQGRIAFFGPSSGQEAAVCGSGFVSRPQDWIFPALREGGVLLMRGFPLERYFGQLFGNVLDVQKGRQQPMHFSSSEYKHLSLSSVIATQLPQAVGAAYAAKLKQQDCVAFGYIGDGGTSEHDFHNAMNFAAVWKVPCLIICQNNQWAISVPFEKQTASDGIAIKATAYGMPGVAVDGNDTLAVIRATQEAHERALAGDGPTLLELVTYRCGGHSSSDDPSRYRDEDKVAPWLKVDPLDRYRTWLGNEGIWDDAQQEDATDELRSHMDEALSIAETADSPEPITMFQDVYHEMPPHLRDQWSSVTEDGSGTAEGAFPL